VDYPVTLEHDDNKTILVSFPDFPEAHTFGTDESDALAHARDALASAIDAYIKDKRDIPLAAALVTKHRITVPALIEAKVRLYETMRTSKIGKAELGRRLGWHLPQVDRLLAMSHGSKLEQLESAFGALGKRLVVVVEDLSTAARKPAPRKTRKAAIRRRSSVAR
jgi:antitoxin HicB